MGCCWYPDVGLDDAFGVWWCWLGVDVGFGVVLVGDDDVGVGPVVALFVEFFDDVFSGLFLFVAGYDVGVEDADGAYVVLSGWGVWLSRDGGLVVVLFH